MQLQADYFSAYHNLKLTRDDAGLLISTYGMQNQCAA